MSYLNQLQQSTNELTIKRKKEYLRYNIGSIINRRLGKKDCNVLEIGSGMGDFVSYCNEHGTDHVDVIDNDKTVLEHIKKSFKTNKAWLASSPVTIKNLGEYDVITMTQVLEHIPKSEHLPILRTLYSHLSPSGVLIITVPNIGNPLAIYERYYDYTHETAFTEHSLMQMVDYAGLKNAKSYVQPFRIPPYNAINIIRIGIQSILHAVMRGLFMANGGVYPSILTTNITLVIEKAA